MGWGRGRLFYKCWWSSSPGIAKWNGGQWLALGSGIGNVNYGGVGVHSVLSLVLNGNDVYAGGTFTNAGGIAACGVARWNGTLWSALGNGLTFEDASEAGTRALALVNTDLHAAGSFTFAGLKSSWGLAIWHQTVPIYPLWIYPLSLASG
jgi:hypothetical protein